MAWEFVNNNIDILLNYKNLEMIHTLLCKFETISYTYLIFDYDEIID